MDGRLTPIQINLWQQGVRAFFRFYQAKAGLTQDEAWTGLREELTLCVVEWDPPAEEWEFQLVHSILVGEHDCTVEEANAMDERSPDATPDQKNILIPVTAKDLKISVLEQEKIRNALSMVLGSGVHHC